MVFNTVFKVYKHSIMCHIASSQVFQPSLDCRKSYIYQDILGSANAKCRVSRFPIDLDLSDDKPDYGSIANNMLVKVGYQSMVARDLKDSLKTIRIKKDKSVDEVSDDSIRHTRRRLTDIILNNDFNFFVTLTLSPDRVNRYSPQSAIDTLNKFCHNYFRRQRGHYVFVPELCEDGAYHFHGFCYLPYISEKYGLVRGKNHYSGDLLDTYNLLDWSYGFSTLKLLNYSDSLTYMKYLSILNSYVSVKKKILPRFYYSGGYLVRKPVLVYADTDDKFLNEIIENGGKQWKPDSRLDIDMVTFYYDSLDKLDDIMSKSDLYFDPYNFVGDEDVEKAREKILQNSKKV